MVERAKIIAATQETIKNRAVTYIPFVASNGSRIMDVNKVKRRPFLSIKRPIGNCYHIIVDLCKVLEGMGIATGQLGMPSDYRTTAAIQN